MFIIGLLGARHSNISHETEDLEGKIVLMMSWKQNCIDYIITYFESNKLQELIYLTHLEWWLVQSWVFLSIFVSPTTLQTRDKDHSYFYSPLHTQCQKHGTSLNISWMNGRRWKNMDACINEWSQRSLWWICISLVPPCWSLLAV